MNKWIIRLRKASIYLGLVIMISLLTFFCATLISEGVSATTVDEIGDSGLIDDTDDNFSLNIKIGRAHV